MYVACVSLMEEMKLCYLGALLVILAPHQGSIILLKRRKNIISHQTYCWKNIYNNQFIKSMCNFDPFLSLSQYTSAVAKAFLINNNVNSTEIWKADCESALCAEFMQPKQESRVTTLRWGQTSGQFQQSMVTPAFLWICLISQQTSQRSRKEELMSALLHRPQI